MVVNEKTLRAISQSLDISPSDFKRAQERYEAVKTWLLNGTYQTGFSPEVYLQGSFRLGTVTRPYKNDKDGEYDIDQVCEIKAPHNRNPALLKKDIGDRLKENSDYERMLDEEGKRCWTIEYASEDDRAGFHLDVLPALPSENSASSQIDITDKDGTSYSWSPSNPKGYYYWFKEQNNFSADFIYEQRREIYDKHQALYGGVEDVPMQLLRTPLQRAIQIMKRHRDVYFVDKDFKPISIIITTIATRTRTEDSIGQIIQDFADYVLARHQSFIRDEGLEQDTILDYEDGVWKIPNPVDIENSIPEPENFADRWAEHDELSVSFFEWASQLRRDARAFSASGISDDLNLRIKTLGAGKSYASILKSAMDKAKTEEIGDNRTLLEMIHLGIEGKIDWDTVQAAAQHEYDVANTKSNKDVAKINFYQITRHRGLSLSEAAVTDVKTVLSDNQNDAAFVLCCNLILGSATYQMLMQCIAERGWDNVMDWPIVRLYVQNKQSVLNQKKVG